MMPESMETTIGAVEATALWRSAKRWLVVWASAGFVPKEKDGKFVMPAGWVQKFPDGPLLVDALRAEMTALIRDGNKAVLADPRLNVAYPDHLRARLAVEITRRKHADWCAAQANAEIAKLRAELESLKSG